MLRASRLADCTRPARVPRLAGAADQMPSRSRLIHLRAQCRKWRRWPATAGRHRTDPDGTKLPSTTAPIPEARKHDADPVRADPVGIGSEKVPKALTPSKYTSGAMTMLLSCGKTPAVTRAASVMTGPGVEEAKHIAVLRHGFQGAVDGGGFAATPSSRYGFAWVFRHGRPRYELETTRPVHPAHCRMLAGSARRDDDHDRRTPTRKRGVCVVSQTTQRPSVWTAMQ